jgi:drug/metabolite transporter (DMT)-like permease
MHKQLLLVDWIVLLALAFVWGSSFILMKEGLVSFSPPQVAALRLFTAGLFFLPYSVSKLKQFKLQLIWKIFIVGLLGNGIPAFLFTWAEAHISSSIAGILNSLTPIFTLTIGVLFFKIKASWLKAIGILIAFGGCVLLILQRNAGVSAVDAQYGWAIVLATICYGTSVNLLKKWLQTVPSLLIVSFAFFMLGSLSAIYLCESDFLSRMHTQPLAWHSLGYVFILGAVGTSIANTLYYRLVQRISPVNASLVTFFIPIVAVAWGYLAGESVGWAHFASMLLILAGVYVVSKG